MSKEYNLNVITKFNNNGEDFENIILKILNNDIFYDSAIYLKNLNDYNKYK